MRANGQWVARKRLMRFLRLEGGELSPKGLFFWRTRYFGFFFNSMKTSWLTFALLVFVTGG
ncbi:MAG: hypothetical protein ABSF60_12240, partial [Verrucomicrobiota bacterium]